MSAFREMGIGKLAGTCSMSEFAIWHREKIPPEKILDIVNSEADSYDNVNIPSRRSRKAVICNTIAHKKDLEEAGFVEVGQYKGNDSQTKPVHVMLWIRPDCVYTPRKRKPRVVKP